MDLQIAIEDMKTMPATRCLCLALVFFSFRILLVAQPFAPVRPVDRLMVFGQAEPRRLSPHPNQREQAITTPCHPVTRTIPLLDGCLFFFLLHLHLLYCHNVLPLLNLAISNYTSADWS
jgi:hypothetical protein